MITKNNKKTTHSFPVGQFFYFANINSIHVSGLKIKRKKWIDENRWGVRRDGVVDRFRSCTISRLPRFFRLHWPTAWYRLRPCWHRNFVWLMSACAVRVAPATTFSLSLTLYYYWKVQQVFYYKLQQSYMALHYWEVQMTNLLQSQSYSYRAWLTNN